MVLLYGLGTFGENALILLCHNVNSSIFTRKSLVGTLFYVIHHCNWFARVKHSSLWSLAFAFGIKEGIQTAGEKMAVIITPAILAGRMMCGAGLFCSTIAPNHERAFMGAM